MVPVLMIRRATAVLVAGLLLSLSACTTSPPEERPTMSPAQIRSAFSQLFEATRAEAPGVTWTDVTKLYAESCDKSGGGTGAFWSYAVRGSAPHDPAASAARVQQLWKARHLQVQVHRYAADDVRITARDADGLVFDFEAASDRVAITGASQCFPGDPHALSTTS